MLVKDKYDSCKNMVEIDIAVQSQFTFVSVYGRKCTLHVYLN